jgi:hypothetical protein
MGRCRKDSAFHKGGEFEHTDFLRKEGFEAMYYKRRALVHADFYCWEKAFADYEKAIKLGGSLKIGDFFPVFVGNLEPSISERFRKLLEQVNEATDNTSLDCRYGTKHHQGSCIALLPYTVARFQDPTIIRCFLQKVGKEKLKDFLQNRGLDTLNKYLDENEKLTVEEKTEFKVQLQNIYYNFSAKIFNPKWPHYFAPLPPKPIKEPTSDAIEFLSMNL